MVSELIVAMSVLGIVIVGILIMIQAVTFEELFNAVGRFLLFVVLALVAACVLRMLLVSVVLPWLVSLKALLLWLTLAVIAVLVLALVVRVAVSKLQH